MNAYENNNEEDYFCGLLVLIQDQDKDNRYDIIDGQQRITTFIIMSCVFRDFYNNKLEEEARSYIFESIKARYDKEKDKLKICTDKEYSDNFQKTVIKKLVIKLIKIISI